MARILVVDDESAITCLLESYLTAVGHSVTAARSSIGSVGWLDRDDFDVAVVDVVMPGPINGLDVCRLLKEDPRTARTRVLIISGVPEMQTKAFEAGADAFLSKPFGLEEIKQCLAHLVRTRAPDPVPAPSSFVLRETIKGFELLAPTTNPAA